MLDVVYKHTLLPLHNNLLKNKFLPQDTNLNSKWSGTDTKRLFNESLKTQAQDWYYRTHNVAYTLNSAGYRTSEFKDIDWSNSVVLFGCSNVFGTGLDDSDTISSQLSKMIGYPVINMGAIGSSMEFALHNSVILNDLSLNPLGVVYVWPDYTRCVEYSRNSLIHHGSWTLEKNNFMDIAIKNQYHTELNALFIQKIARALWRGKTKMYETTFADNNKLLKCEVLQYIDLARDLLHPGRLSATVAATQIAKGLGIKNETRC